jgi:Putative Ig domain
MKHGFFALLYSILILLALSAEASAQSTYLNLYSQPGDDFGGRPNLKGKAFSYVETDGVWQLNCYDMDHDGHADRVSLRFLPYNTIPVSHWSITVGTERTGVNLAPGYYDRGNQFGVPYLVIGNGLGCARGAGEFTILEAKIDESNPVLPKVVRFAVKFRYLCDGIGPAGLVGVFSYNSTAPDVHDGPLILTESPYLPTTETNLPLSHQLTMLGGVPPYHFEQTASKLPPDFSLSPEGLLQGTPTTTGDYWTDVVVTDAVNIPLSTAHQASFRVSFRVVEPPPPEPLNITTQAVASANTDQPYNFQLETKGGRRPLVWSLVRGQLPEGLSLSSGGVISGMAKTAGVYSFTVQVADSFAQQAQGDYLIKVLTPPRIDDVSYKAKKGKLNISGDRFDPAAKLFVDDREVTPKTQDTTSLFVKKLFLTPGAHSVKLVNPDGGSATVALQVE